MMNNELFERDDNIECPLADGNLILKSQRYMKEKRAARLVDIHLGGDVIWQQR